MAVFVWDKRKHPLMPCSEKRARLLLARGRAVVVKHYPFAIRLKDRIGGEIQPLRVKIDPGSRYTGMAVVRELGEKITVLHLFQINHRGLSISENLTASRVDTILSWVNKLQRLAPVAAISQELVRFDMQRINNPEINGVEYQQGKLQGYEVREYLLEKWSRQCAYCGAQRVPLEIEHIVPKANGGSNRVSNLTLACRVCNQQKGSQPIEAFLGKKPAVLQRIKAQAQRPLKDAAAVNSTRWALANRLKTTGLPIELASGGRTKFNRVTQGIPKSHALDAACVGEIGTLVGWNIPTMAIKCTGRGSYQRTRLDKYGFPRGYLLRQKAVHGFQTGDQVSANVTKGKKTGTYKGRVAVRASGFFNITTATGVVQGISHQYCRLIARNDGYGYVFQPKVA